MESSPETKKMDEAPAQRSLEQIKAEYADVCAKAGEAHLMMKARETELHALTQRLVSLHNEYGKAEAAAKEAKASA